MREMFLTVVCVIGSSLSYFVGGADMMFIVLCVFLAVDYISGLIVAGVFKNSAKTENGKLNSHVGYKGIIKKLYTLCMVGVANMLDNVLGTDFIRGGVIAVFISNETISIIENAGLMGVPIPSVLYKAIEILNKKDGTDDG